MAVSVVDEPLQIAAPEPALIMGRLLTVTVIDAVLLQPPVVPVIVYTVVDDGVAVTLAPVVADNPLAGSQVYAAPPDAVSVVDEPLQIGLTPALTVMVGNAFTVTDIEAVLLQPAALVPVTVYVILLVGLAVTVAPVVAESPVAGDHL